MLDQKDFDALVSKVGQEAATQLRAEGDRIKASVETTMNGKFTELQKGQITQEQFNAFKAEAMGPVNEFAEKIGKLEESMKAQGIVLNELNENKEAGKNKSIEEFLIELAPKIKEATKNKTFIEITGTQLKAAGVHSLTGSIQDMGTPPGSPYLPGLTGTGLDLFDIRQNPNFLINRVNLGRTNSPRLAWINETSTTGDYTASAAVAEGGLKPQVQHKFQVEMSTAKKAAAWAELTEEFEDDAPQLATQVRRLLELDVLRAWDDAIQTAVIAAARPFEITAFATGAERIDKPNKYDAIGAMLAQVATYNYVANTVGLHPATLWNMYMTKADVVTSGSREYLVPPFLNLIQPKIVEATKLAVGYGLVGDLMQYNVDIYKDFTLRIGWINDEFIYNKFAIVGELRYHNYISDNRKKALVYSLLSTVQSAINSGS